MTAKPTIVDCGHTVPAPEHAIRQPDGRRICADCDSKTVKPLRRK